MMCRCNIPETPGALYNNCSPRMDRTYGRYFHFRKSNRTRIHFVVQHGLNVLSCCSESAEFGIKASAGFALPKFDWGPDRRSGKNFDCFSCQVCLGFSRGLPSFSISLSFFLSYRLSGILSSRCCCLFFPLLFKRLAASCPLSAGWMRHCFWRSDIIAFGFPLAWRESCSKFHSQCLA